jgi:lysophospholipase L1-like esterase
LGDSTAVGAGADRVQDTIAGRLAFDFPGSDIINVGTNGSIIRDVLSQLEPVKDQKFDMVIISTGGNDVISFTSLYKIQQDLEQIFQITKNMCEQKVFFLLYVNFAATPLFPALIRLLLIRRAKLLYEIIRGVGVRERVPIIELFAEPKDDPMQGNPSFYFAKDGIHPNSEGYRLWYNRMWRVMTSRGFYYSHHDANLMGSETFASQPTESVSH